MKMLEEMSEQAVDILFRFIENADFSDLDRLEILSRVPQRSRILPRAFRASLRGVLAAALAGRSRAVDEIWNGITQMEYVRSVYADCRKRSGTESLSVRLGGLREKVFASGLLLSLTGTGEGIARAEKALAPRTGRYGPPVLAVICTAESCIP